MIPKSIGNIFNLFVSFPRLDAGEKMCIDKKLLIDPKACRLGFHYLDRENPEVGFCYGLIMTRDQIRNPIICVLSSPIALISLAGASLSLLGFCTK